MRRDEREASDEVNDSGELPISEPRTVLVTGATGLVGRALVRSLAQSGTSVLALSRDVRKAERLLGKASVRCIERLDALPDDIVIDAVVHLAGARVLDRRWTASRREALVRSRTDIAAQVVALASRLRQAPRVLVGASAVSYYGDSGVVRRVESDVPVGQGFGSRLCVGVEAEASRALALGMRVVALRLGIVLARNDGALPPLAASARFGFGAELGSGRQPVSWIHVVDVVRLIRFAIETQGVRGPVNAAAPETPAQSDFIRAIADRFGRRVHVRVPAAVLRGLLGERAALLLEGQVAVPRAALDAGFVFLHPTLAGALKDLLP